MLWPISEGCLQGGEKKVAGMRYRRHEESFVDDGTVVLVAVTTHRGCAPMQRLIQSNSSVCALRCLPGRYVKNSKAGQQCFKRIGWGALFLSQSASISQQLQFIFTLCQPGQSCTGVNSFNPQKALGRRGVDRVRCLLTAPQNDSSAQALKPRERP